MTLPTRRQWAISAGFLACLIVPLALIGWVLGAPLGVAALPGVAVGFVVTLQTHSRRAGLLAVAVMTGLAFVSTLAAASTVAAAVWMGLVGLGYGLSALRGWHRLIQQMVIWSAYIVINPLQAGATSKLEPVGTVRFDLHAALVTAAVILVAGAAIALLAGFVKGTSRPREALARRTAWVMAGVLAVLLAGGTAVVVGLDRYPAGGWLLLTIIVITQPSVHGTYRHTLDRAAGTFAGVLAAGLIGLWLGESHARVVIALGLLVIAFAFMQVPGRYWAYVLFLTPAVVLLGSTPDQTATLAAERLAFTLAGAIAVTAAAFGISAVNRRSSA